MIIYIYIYPFWPADSRSPAWAVRYWPAGEKDGIPATTTQLILKLNLNPKARLKNAIHLSQHCIANPEKNEAQATQIEKESRYEFLKQNLNCESTQKPQPPGDSAPGSESWTSDPSKQPRPNLQFVDRKM